MDRWQNKVALVTGVSAGIGEAITKLLVEDGMTVVGLARRENRLEELKSKLENKAGKFIPIKADLTKEEDIISAFKWVESNLGAVHVLVNNAGSAVKFAPMEETETEVWQQLYDLNVLAVQICCREAIKSMKSHNVEDGHIINISSYAAHMSAPSVGAVAYYASKKAVNVISEGLRIELRSQKSKIKVTTITPARVNTEIFVAVGKPEIKNVYALESSDVAKSVEYVLQLPPNVLITELVIRDVLDDIK